MDTGRLRKEANFALKRLVDSLGLNGAAYIKNTNHYIMVNRIPEKNIMGKTYGAESNELYNLLQKTYWDYEEKTSVLQNGLITINIGRNVNDSQMLVTCIHEMLHAHREILTNDQNRMGDVPNIIELNGRSVKTNPDHETQAFGNYLDVAQDVFIGSFDDSSTAKEEASKLSEDELKEKDSRTSNQFLRQQAIDETLIEVMSITAYYLYKNKFNSIEDTLDCIQEISRINGNEDFASLINIMKRHNNLDLFKWIIDPLTYQQDTLNYDFFKNYITNEDEKDAKKLIDYYVLENLGDDIINKSTKKSKRKVK
ncbi:MAG: hypothetical protein IJI43_04255 [Bacilli bacterium]|nr:hypothetical protein [Bacilli bacterium]